MRFYVLVLTFFYSNLFAESYDKNTYNEYYATSTNIHGHIFKINLKVFKNSKILVSHFICYKCFKKGVTNLEKGFKKANCKNNKSKGRLFSVYCNSETIMAGKYEKQIQGDLTEAFMSGRNRTETVYPYGKAHFIFLNKKEYLNYKKFIKTQKFITTSEFKNKQENVIITEALTLYNENKLADDSSVINKRLNKLDNIDQKQEIILRKELEKEKNRLEEEIAKLKEINKRNKELSLLDTEPPKIEIVSSQIKNKQGIVKGVVIDNVKVAELTVNGEQIAFDNKGSFNYSSFIPKKGIKLTIQATDIKGLASEKIIALQRKKVLAKNNLNFNELNPLRHQGKKNKNALALVIGVSVYENAPEAKYADRDANYFADFSENILGVKQNNIKLISNTQANHTRIKTALKIWLKGYSTPEESDIYIFFAGHGLASTDGKELYLLPYDGEPRLLEDTALLRSEIFDTVKSINPKSVTVFLDACYSGQTREKDMILADARPIAIVPIESDVPKNFTVFSASSGSEISGSLPEADHGLFSYFLMKGLEGDADANNDNKITNGELHSYVRSNVTRQAVRLGREQTPQLQGDKNRVLVEFN